MAVGSQTRDASMAANVEWIAAHAPPGSRIVLWAHDGHINKAPNERPVQQNGTMSFPLKIKNYHDLRDATSHPPNVDSRGAGKLAGLRADPRIHTVLEQMRRSSAIPEVEPISIEKSALVRTPICQRTRPKGAGSGT
jgi:hypothetical protein